MEEDSCFGVASPVRMQKIFAYVSVAALSALAFVTTTSSVGQAGPPNVRGRVSGHEKLVLDVYAEAAKPESKRWTWREPSPSVAASLRTLSAVPSRDICVAAMTSASQERQELKLNLAGGRLSVTTAAVTPGTSVVLKNSDSMKHRPYVTSGTGQRLLQAEDLLPGASRIWSVPGPGRYEIRDELTPSVRTFLVVDAQVAAVTYPNREGFFSFALPAGDYVLKAFFNGRAVGKPINFAAKDRAVVDLKDPMKLDEGGEAK
jgi:hypothetical protein